MTQKEKDMVKVAEEAAEEGKNQTVNPTANPGMAEVSDTSGEIDAGVLTDDDLKDLEATGISVYRERFIGKDKKKYWGYYVAGILRGRKVKVSLQATDGGGYELLDIVFGEDASVPLMQKPFTMKDEKGNVTSSGYTYFAVSQDEDGNYYSQVKPSRKSDKALLEMIIKREIRLMEEGETVASAG